MKEIMIHFRENWRFIYLLSNKYVWHVSSMSVAVPDVWLRATWPSIYPVGLGLSDKDWRKKWKFKMIHDEYKNNRFGMLGSREEGSYPRLWTHGRRLALGRISGLDGCGADHWRSSEEVVQREDNGKVIRDGPTREEEPGLQGRKEWGSIGLKTMA